MSKQTAVSSGNIFGTANCYRIYSSWHTSVFWHPMTITDKFYYNHMEIKMLISWSIRKHKGKKHNLKHMAVLDNY